MSTIRSTTIGTIGTGISITEMTMTRLPAGRMD